MPAKRTHKTYVGRVYLGHGKYRWVGRFQTRNARDAAVARSRVDLERAQSTDLTCAEWVDRYLARYQRDHKASSTDTARGALRRFRGDFGDRPLRSIKRIEAIEWAESKPAGVVWVVVTCMNAAVDAELLERNPFRGCGRRVRGRADQAPPTEAEFDLMLGACTTLGDYAAQMRALLVSRPTAA